MNQCPHTFSFPYVFLNCRYMQSPVHPIMERIQSLWSERGDGGRPTTDFSRGITFSRMRVFEKNEGNCSPKWVTLTLALYDNLTFMGRSTSSFLLLWKILLPPSPSRSLSRSPSPPLPPPYNILIFVKKIETIICFHPLFV